MLPPLALWARGTALAFLTLRQQTQETCGPSNLISEDLDSAALKHILAMPSSIYTQFVMEELENVFQIKQNHATNNKSGLTPHLMDMQISRIPHVPTYL